MGNFMEKITLENGRDRLNAKSGDIPESQIRMVDVDAVPDTGAWTLIINEEIRQRLELATIDTVKSTMADGVSDEYDLTEPVVIRWKNRQTIQSAVVIPTSQNILLGAIPLEALDLYVDPVNQKLAGVHGDIPVYMT